MEIEPILSSLNEGAAVSADSAQTAYLYRRQLLLNQFTRGAKWFYWIAALSLVNSVVFLAGEDWSVIIGLGVTQVIDAFISGIGDALDGNWVLFSRVVAFVLDLAVAGLFACFGWLSLRWHRRAMALGLFLYFLDTVVLLLFRDWFAAAFHGWALYGLWLGHWAMLVLEAMDKLPANAGSTPA